MNEIEKAIEVFKRGGIVIFPTDTAFGIGCRIDNEQTIRKLLEIKNRPTNQPTPVLVDSIKMSEEYLKPISIEVQDLMNKYWPGALTIILPCKIDKVSSLVRGGGSTIGVRVPNNQTILQIIKELGVPILGPSANFHGEKTPYNFVNLNPKLLKLADFVIRGETSAGNISTVIDCSAKPWKILRQGAVKIDL